MAEPTGAVQDGNAVRRCSSWLIDQAWFDNLILVLIMVNCAILALQTPIEGPAVMCVMPAPGNEYDEANHNCDTSAGQCQRQGRCSANGPLQPGFEFWNLAQAVELGFTVTFTLEAAVRIIADGFIMPENAYLRIGWNWLDWIVVVMSWVSMIPGVSNFSAIRTVRVLRPLRTMTRIPGMTVIVGALMRSLLPLGNVVLLCAVIFFIFGILAAQVWTDMPKVHCGASSLYYDSLQPWTTKEYSTDYRCHSLTSYEVTPKPCGCDELGDESGACGRGSAGNLCIGIEADRDGTMTWSSYSPDSQFKYNYSTVCDCGEVCTTALHFYCDSMGSVSFDHIGNTMMTIFQCATLEGWTDIMYRCDDSDNPWQGWGWLYWLVLIFVAGLFVVNIALAVIADSYSKSEDDEREQARKAKENRLRDLFREMDADLSGSVDAAELREGLLMKKLVKSNKAIDEIMKKGDLDGDGVLNWQEFQLCFPDVFTEIDGVVDDDRNAVTGRGSHGKADSQFWNCLQRSDKMRQHPCIVRLRAVVEHPAFSAFIMLFIGVNTALLACESHSEALCTEMEKVMSKDFRLTGTCMSAALTDFLDAANVFLTLFFAVEMVLKLVGLGLVEYFAEPFNRFDAFIVVTSMYELIKMTGDSADQNSGGFITVLRAGRLFRVFRLARTWGDLKAVLVTISKTFSSLIPLSIILCLFMFIFALLGMQLFGGKFFFPSRDDCSSWDMIQTGCSIPRANFDTFGTAFVTIFQMLSGEDWNVVMYDGIAAAGAGAFFYFLIVVVLGSFMILNLFLTILLSGFEDTDDDDDEDSELKQEDGDTTVTAQEGPIPWPQKLRLCCETVGKVSPGDGAGARTKPNGIPMPQELPEEKQTRKDEASQTIPDHKACGCISKGNAIRQTCFRLINNSWFDNFILVCIIVSSVALAFQNPFSHGGPNETGTAAAALHWLDVIFLIVFTFEMVCKHVALGIIFHSDAYWQNPWNIMDGSIVILGYVGMLASGLPQLKPLRAVRTLRALRPLRAASRFEGMKLAVTCLLKSIPLMLPTALVSFLFFLVFAILGVQLFAGRYWYCDLSSTNQKVAVESLHRLYSGESQAHESFPYMNNGSGEVYEQAGRLLNSSMILNYYTNEKEAVYAWVEALNSNAGFDRFCQHAESFHGTACTRAECRLTGGEWTNQMTHFDNIYQALLCLFEMSTTEGWPDVMWAAVDSDSIPGRQPSHGRSKVYFLYFISFLVVGNFFVLNLFVGVVIDNYLRLEKEAAGPPGERGEKVAGPQVLYTPSQAEWAAQHKHNMSATEATARTSLPSDAVIRPPASAVRNCIFHLVENPAFDVFITVLIAINVFVLASKHRDMSDQFEDVFLSSANWFFTIAFAVEAALKITAYGPTNYFTIEHTSVGAVRGHRTGNWWNDFDFFLVLVSIIDKIGNFGGFATLFRIFRVLRIIRVARSAKELNRLASTIIMSIPALANVGSLLMLLLLIYSILGVNFFFSACGVPPYFTIAEDGTTFRSEAEDGTASVFDPCSDADYGYGFDGFVSVNLKLNKALWYVYALDTDQDGVLTSAEFENMRSATAGEYVKANATIAAPIWTASGRSVSYGHTPAKLLELAVNISTVPQPAETAMRRWAADTVSEQRAYMLKKVEAFEYREQTGFNAETWYEFDQKLKDYSKDPDWDGKMRCTAVTMKCSGYKEPSQSLIDGQSDKPPYAECVCDNIDWNANFGSFGVAFVTLIRMSTGEYWNGIMHDLMDQGHPLSFFYFFTFMILATFIMLNLVVAVILVNYKDQQDKTDGPTPQSGSGADVLPTVESIMPNDVPTATTRRSNPENVESDGEVIVPMAAENSPLKVKTEQEP